jgi:RNA polymerase sigma factor (sigma-70 family)
MDLMFPIVAGVVIAVAGGLLLDRIRGVASRAEGRMARALRDLPNETDRERWMEEFRRILSEYEGRPFKQYLESREQIRAAKGLVRVYAQPAPKPADHVQEDDMSETKEVALGAVATRYITRATLGEALENLSYRERRVLELRYGLGGEPPRTLDEVGRTFNLTAERINQIEIQSLKKLQSLAEAQKLRESVNGP